LRARQAAMQKQRTRFSLRIPPKLRFALAWTIFFIVIGIVIQSIQAGFFVFIDFFGSNYADWFRSLGAFTTPVTYSSPEALLTTLFSRWYYFLYTGGLVSLIWAIIDSIINYEIYFKR